MSFFSWDLVFFIVLNIIGITASVLYSRYYDKKMESNFNKISPQKRRTYKLKHFWIKASTTSTAVALIFGGYELLYASSSGAKFLGAFLLVTGFQIFLWVIGVRLEILSNVPANIDPFDYINEQYKLGVSQQIYKVSDRKS